MRKKFISTTFKLQFRKFFSLILFTKTWPINLAIKYKINCSNSTKLQKILPQWMYILHIILANFYLNNWQHHAYSHWRINTYKNLFVNVCVRTRALCNLSFYGSRVKNSGLDLWVNMEQWNKRTRCMPLLETF